MDGRVQLPVIQYLKARFNATYVDTITEPGPNAILATQSDDVLLQSINTRVEISLKRHGSNSIAIVGHHDCAGNPISKTHQLKQIALSNKYLSDRYPTANVIGLWVNENWEVEEV